MFSGGNSMILDIEGHSIVLFGGFIQWHLAPPLEGEMPTPKKKRVTQTLRHHKPIFTAQLE